MPLFSFCKKDTTIPFMCNTATQNLIAKKVSLSIFLMRNNEGFTNSSFIAYYSNIKKKRNKRLINFEKLWFNLPLHTSGKSFFI